MLKIPSTSEKSATSLSNTAFPAFFTMEWSGVTSPWTLLSYISWSICIGYFISILCVISRECSLWAFVMKTTCAILHEGYSNATLALGISSTQRSGKFRPDSVILGTFPYDFPVWYILNSSTAYLMASPEDFRFEKFKSVSPEMSPSLGDGF